MFRALTLRRGVEMSRKTEGGEENSALVKIRPTLLLELTEPNVVVWIIWELLTKEIPEIG